MVNLPPAFVERMQQQLGAEFEDFLKSYDLPRYYGLRVNTLKIGVDQFLAHSPYKLEPVPWVEGGFYYQEGQRPGKHPYYHAGLYYIQEPSAMTPGALLEVEPGETVLDLCAAPGGKSTQVAAKLQRQGLLVSNDINFDRVKALTKNIELSGVTNSVITNESPDKLAKVFRGFFDKILVDAPCSGEGMFRKDLDAAKQWTVFNVATCVGMQKDILDQAAVMLKVGGKMLYSTCTFAPDENEGMISQFLGRHPGFRLVDLPQYEGFSRGELPETVRLWPHKLEGEGHFLALLEKTAMAEAEATAIPEQLRKTKGKPVMVARGPKVLKEQELVDFLSFCREHLTIEIKGPIVQVGERIYQVPEALVEKLPRLGELKIYRPGWYLGDLKKGRFEPSQALAMGLAAKQVKQVIDFAVEDAELYRYLKGETLNRPAEKGWILVTVAGYPLGWAKQAGGIVKNYYPKAWRQLV